MMKQIKKHNPVWVILLFMCSFLYAQDLPLPEHPRPDFQRDQWQNLNGKWAFVFDTKDAGLEEGWADGESPFDHTILVPFPWGSKLSGVEDEADIGWYMRDISVDPLWKGKRVFLTVGASDWETSIWLDGCLLGKHQGGYVPFSFELTDHILFDPWTLIGPGIVATAPGPDPIRCGVPKTVTVTYLPDPAGPQGWSATQGRRSQ